MIKNIILLILLLGTSIFASEAQVEVKWAKDYETGMKEAARFNNDLKENLGSNFAYKLAI